MKSGLRQRPTFEGIVDYIANGQETIKYPGRLAKFMGNHPYLNQLDGEGCKINRKRHGKHRRRSTESRH
jgi:hypothetical protein